MFRFQTSKELKNKKIRIRFDEDIEPQEIFLDKLAKEKSEETGISETKFETPFPKKIFQVFYLITVLLILFFFAKVFHLQILNGENFTALADRNKFITDSIKAVRGVIYDKNLEQIVFNQISFDLVCDKRSLNQRDGEKNKILKEISQIIEEDIDSLEKRVAQADSSYVLIVANLEHQKLVLLKTRIDEFFGCHIQTSPMRDYGNGEIFAHLIGYTGGIRDEELRAFDGSSIFDWIGREGIERSYEEVLRQNPGKIQVKRDALGNLISTEIIFLPQSGKSLVLHLDSQLQRKIKQELMEALARVGAEKGAVIAINPRNGGVLSLVSLPSFDNNLFNPGSDTQALKNLLINPQNPLFNRAISGQYPPGSVVKPLIALAALEEEIIKPEEQIYCPAELQIQHQYIPEIIYRFRDWRYHGWTDIRKAIADSVNVYFYKVGGGHKESKGLGPSRIKEYLELFGLGAETKINLPGEAKGLIPNPAWKREVKNEDWWDGDTYHLSIGQSNLLTSPIQISSAFAAIANKGILYQPVVVQKIIDTSADLARTVDRIEPKIIRENFISQRNLEIVRQGMRQAVISDTGTARILNELSVEAAAKTGTAQTAKKGFFHNWIVVFAPYENPEIVLVIIIEDIEGFQSPTNLAAKEILEWYFQNNI